MKRIKASDKNILDEIIVALENGKVLVLPTDTVYGLVCDASNEKAVEKIFQIKNRDKSKTLPVFVKDIQMAKWFAEINDKQEKIVKMAWPGAVTFVFGAKSGLAPLIYKDNTIALRAPNSGLIMKILETIKKPLAQTSANISAQPATNKISEVIEQFEGRAVQPDIIIDAGDLADNKPSTIIDLTENKINILRK